MSGAELAQWIGVLAGAAMLCVQALLAIYAFHRYFLLGLYLRHRGEGRPTAPVEENWPSITVQLPVHDELYVVERLIDAACALEYPLDRLEIQILDDSTDETTGLAEARAGFHRERGIDVRVLHRDVRRGFKAGALQEGLTRARGELLAIFDADFLPPPDFLRRLVPHFRAADVGMVQARWGHVNRGYSRFTDWQAVFLDAHFLVEQRARERSGRFFNFNGTAGVWRRTCIEAAGGWQADTLTEDLDLSYRAQLAGWRFHFLPEVVAPAELPVDIHAFQTQQRRWAKGSIQTAVKLLPRVWAGRLPLAVKLESWFHLTCNVSYPLVLLSGLLLSVALLFPRSADPRLVAAWSVLLGAATVGVGLFFAASQRVQGRTWKSSLARVPGALGLGMGMSLTQARAVLEALMFRFGEWERTPKYAIVHPGQTWKNKRYVPRMEGAGAGEAALSLIFLGVLSLAAVRHQYLPIPFLAYLSSGLGYVAWLSWRARPATRSGGAGPFARFAKS